MSKLGKCAIVFGSVFLGLAIIGGIFIGFGVVREYSGGTLSESVNEFVDEVQNYSGTVSDGKEISGQTVCTIDESINEIELKNFVSEITFVPVSSSDITIEYSGLNVTASDGYYSIDQENGKVTINEHGEFFAPSIEFMGIDLIPGGTAGRVKVSIPESFKGRIVMESSAGEITFSGFTLDELVFSNAAGELNVTGCVIGKLTCRNAAAELNFKGSVSGIDISDNLGECNIKSDVPFTLPCSVSDSLGEIDVTLPAGGRLNVSTNNVLGEINIDDSVRDASGTAFSISDSLGEINIEVE